MLHRITDDTTNYFVSKFNNSKNTVKDYIDSRHQNDCYMKAQQIRTCATTAN